MKINMEKRGGGGRRRRRRRRRTDGNLREEGGGEGSILAMSLKHQESSRHLSINSLGFSSYYYGGYDWFAFFSCFLLHLSDGDVAIKTSIEASGWSVRVASACLPSSGRFPPHQFLPQFIPFSSTSTTAATANIKFFTYSYRYIFHTRFWISRIKWKWLSFWLIRMHCCIWGG